MPGNTHLLSPFLKRGDTDSANSCRPISLFPIVSKILERIAADQLINYLESNKLLSTSQHGFRLKLSTQSALSVITDNIYSNMDRECILLLTLCDLSTAFDSVSHTALINNCAMLIVDSYRFRDHVNNRKSIRLNNVIHNTAYGVPQSSMTGPVV